MAGQLDMRGRATVGHGSQVKYRFLVFDWYFNVAVNDPGAPGNNWTTGVS
jgi:hypothetical protein